MTIDVRFVHAGDVPAVLELIAEVLGEFGLEFGKGATTDEELRELPDSYTSRGAQFWVAERGGELLGTCGVVPLSPDTFELRKMYLRSAARGLGIGTRLLDVVVAWSRERQAVRLVLDTVDEMTRAIAFYEANGFTRDDAQIRGSRCTRGYSRAL